MITLRVLVVDDEPLVRRDIIRLLHAEPGIEVSGEARNGLEALEQIERLSPDLVFLDVRMPELDGLGVVAALDPMKSPFLVFVTAFDKYALQAFDAHAVDYLLKPFDPDRFRWALARTRERVAARQGPSPEAILRALQTTAGQPRYLERIAARGSRRTVVLPLDQVRWIEAADNYVRLHTGDATHLSRRTMRELVQLLHPERFARVHRSAIVNLEYVRQIEPLGDGDYEITLEGGAKVPLARSHKAAFERRVGGIV